MAVEIMILCLRPLPAMDGGWNSAKWRTPKFAAAVAVRRQSVAEWMVGLSAAGRTELGTIAQAPFVAGLSMAGPTATFEVALAYAAVVAESCAGVVILGEELVADRRASIDESDGSAIELRWRAIDAEAARSEPGYQPVRDVADDHRPTQTFPFPITVDGVVLQFPEMLPLAADTADTGPERARHSTSEKITAQMAAIEDHEEKHEIEAAGAGQAASASDPQPRAPSQAEVIAGEQDWSDVMP